MAGIRRLVIDVLKPHDPDLVEFTQKISDIDSVDSATITLLEHDLEVQNVTLTCEGEGLDRSSIEGKIEALGASVHSIDQVACGEAIVGDQSNP